VAIIVKLIAGTPDAAKVVAAAAKICYSPSGAVGIMDGLDPQKTASFLKMLRESGHLSPFEHVSFTFAIEGLSRVASHQLVRHRPGQLFAAEPALCRHVRAGVHNTAGSGKKY